MQNAWLRNCRNILAFIKKEINYIKGETGRKMLGDHSLIESNKTLTAPLHLLISLMPTWEIKEQVFPKKLFSLNNFLFSVGKS